jgi:HD-GYP domain-containing protein (c-di-GMP phosphodiesterase class II)
VRDALHATTSNRPYRPKMSLQRARDEIAAHAGSQFDPDVTRALLAELVATPEPGEGADLTPPDAELTAVSP